MAASPTTLQGYTPSQDRFADQAGTYPIVGTVAPLLARTVTQDFLVTVKNATGIIVIVSATAKVSTPSVVFTVRGFDPVSGKTWDIAASVALTDVGLQVVRIAPNLTAADCKVNDIVPEYVVIHAEAGNANALTYSVAAIVTP